jgi:hypothetical protein
MWIAELDVQASHIFPEIITLAVLLACGILLGIAIGKVMGE